VVERDPIAEQRMADLKATQKTNAEVALRNRDRRYSALSTSNQGYGPAPNSALATAVGGTGSPLLSTPQAVGG
jgi:hypothetical protein